MQMRKLDATIDRQIIVGMIVSTPYLKAVAPMYHPDLLMAPYARIVADWCITYLNKYNKAPSAEIQDIFNSKQRENILGGEEVGLIEDFLSGLSQEYERSDKFNSDYLLDQTERLFRQRNLQFLKDDLTSLLAGGELEEAEAALLDFKKVERPVAQGIEALDDMEAYQKAFESRKEPLFRMPGPLGEMVNPHLIREGFVAFLGRGKIGKTWRMFDFGFRAVRERCNVALFHAGDLSQDDHMIRQGVFLAKKSNDPRYCKELLVPELDCETNQKALPTCPNRRSSSVSVWTDDGELDLDMVGRHKSCIECKNEKHFRGAVWYSKRARVDPLGWREAWVATTEWKKRHKAGRLKVSCHPTSTLTVRKIEQQLDMWEQYDGFVPDVLLIDYPDIMDKDDPREEGRTVENTRWKLLRRLCQERHILLIVVTQTNAEGYGGDPKVTDTGEDKRKAQHVTAFFGLNQTEEEEELGIVRITNLLAREGKRDARHVKIIQCLEMGQPYIASFYYYPKKEKKS